MDMRSVSAAQGPGGAWDDRSLDGTHNCGVPSFEGGAGRGGRIVNSEANRIYKSPQRQAAAHWGHGSRTEPVRRMPEVGVLNPALAGGLLDAIAGWTVAALSRKGCGRYIIETSAHE